MVDKSFAIIPGGTSDGSVLRARDVERELRGVDLDPKVKSLLYRLAEINHVNMKGIAELATLFDTMIDTMTEFGAVAENMKAMTDKLQRREADVDGDVGTESSPYSPN